MYQLLILVVLQNYSMFIAGFQLSILTNCVTHLVFLKWKTETTQKKIQCPEKCIPGVAKRGQ